MSLDEIKTAYSAEAAVSPKLDISIQSTASSPLSPPNSSSPLASRPRRRRHALLHTLHTTLSILLLFLTYFLAQYDKFILSYFQPSILSSLALTPPDYALLSGYATGIVYALLALPIAYAADYTSSRVWLLAACAAWWSLCVLCQGFAHNFAQMLLARVGMGAGQAAVEALSVSLISDLVGWRSVVLGESVFYVGVYVGEAVSGQIATAFARTGTSWRVAMRAIGIVGVVVAVAVRVVLREPGRREGIVGGLMGMEGLEGGLVSTRSRRSKLRAARADFVATLEYVLRMRSFWLLVLSASFRQLAGNVFGYYMPSYLSNTYPSEPELLSRYGIIVGVVGTVSVLGGGALTSLLWHKTKLTPVYLTAIGGMISSVFVLLMIFSKDIAGGDEGRGTIILYGTMSAAYLTAETWLGALFALVALLLPPAYKTFGLAIWGTIQVLVYSTGPEIIGFALRNTDPASEEYTRITQVALAVIISIGYWIAGLGFLFAIPLVRRDLERDFVKGRLSIERRLGVGIFLSVLAALVVALFVVSIVYKT